MKYKIACDYRGDGPPRWDVTEVMHVTPGDRFALTVNREVDRLLASQPADDRVKAYAEQIKSKAADKLSRRLGWMTRAHPPTYSFFAPVASVTPDRENRLPRKAIKHAHFNELWIRAVTRRHGLDSSVERRPVQCSRAGPIHLELTHHEDTRTVFGFEKGPFAGTCARSVLASRLRHRSAWLSYSIAQPGNWCWRWQPA